MGSEGSGPVDDAVGSNPGGGAVVQYDGDFTQPGCHGHAIEGLCGHPFTADALDPHRREPDELILSVVAGWPRNFDTRRAVDLGFEADASFDDIIKVHIEDELGGRVGPR